MDGTPWPTAPIAWDLTTTTCLERTERTGEDTLTTAYMNTVLVLTLIAAWYGTEALEEKVEDWPLAAWSFIAKTMALGQNSWENTTKGLETMPIVGTALDLKYSFIYKITIVLEMDKG